MKSFKFFIIFWILAIMSACELDNINPENGIYWEAPLSDTLSAGLSYNEMEGLLIAGDASGNLYALQDGSGLENWVRSFSNETIEAVYAGGNYVFCLSRNTLNETQLRKLSLNEGIVEWHSNISENIEKRIFIDDYTSGSSRIVMPALSNLFVWYPSDQHLEKYAFTQSASLTALTAAVSSSGTRYYYAADSYGVVLKLDANFQVLSENQEAKSTSPIFTGAITTGSSSQYGDFLFIGTTQGIKMFSLPDLVLQTTLQQDAVGEGLIWDPSQEKLFALLSVYPHSGLACYLPDGLQEQWISQTTGDVRYSPLALSLALNLLAYIDDYGYLNIVDSQSSTLVSQSYFGTLEQTGIHFAKNALETKLFIPLSTPSKVIAYDWSFGEQNQSSSSSGF